MRSAGRAATRRRVRLIALAVVVAALLTPAVASAQLSVLGAISNVTNLSGAVSVGVSGNDAFATAYWPGQLTAVNLANPASLSIDGSTSPTSSLQNGTNVAFAGHYAFVVSKNRNASGSSNDDGSGNSLTIVDISNPANPTVVGSVRDPNQLFGSYGVAVSGQYAYVAYQGVLFGQPSTPDTSTGGFTVIDMHSATTPNNPTVVANIDNGSLPSPYTGSNALQHATSVAISGTYAYVTGFYGSTVVAINIATPASPTITKVLRNAAITNPVDLAVQGSYLYLANQVSGSSPQLVVINIATPTAPAVVGTLNNANLNGAYRIRVRGAFPYESASSAAAVGAIDIADPVHPRLADFVQDAGHLNSTTGLDLDASGRYVVASSPRSSTESNATYPPFTNTTGTISTIDLIPHPISVAIAPSSEPPNPTGQTTANFTFAVNDTVSSVQCQLDSAGFMPCTSPTSQTYSGLSATSHTFTVQATDAAGNTTSASYTWTVNAGAPMPGSPGPQITGTPQAGNQLTVSNGTWTGSPTYTYQWLRCSPSCTVIAGATSASYTVQASDIGATLEATVTATNGAGSSQATAGPTATVTGPPQNTSAPVISGTPQAGNQLTVSNGTWTGSPTYTYQWLRCSPSCTVIAGATSASYTVQASDIGATLEATVTATNGAGSSQATAGPTATVTGAPQNTSPPVISGIAQVGQALTVSKGTWTPTPSSYTAQWERCGAGNTCTPIGGATNGTYTVSTADVGFSLEAIVSAYDAASPATPGTYTAGPTSVVPAPTPANTSPPVITGTPQSGQTLTASKGAWTNSPTSYSPQWLRCTSAGTGCTAIAGATHGSYTAQVGDVGSRLEATVTATNAYGSMSATSAPTSVVVGKPANTSAPTVAGRPVVGGRLTASPGTWVGSPTFSYQWLLCRTYCLAIAGATNNTFTARAGDVGDQIRVQVKGQSALGFQTVSSPMVGPVYPNAQTVGSALAKLLVPRGKHATIKGVLAGAFKFAFTAPSAGKLVVNWYYLPKGASLTKHKRGAPQPVLMATGVVTFTAAGQRKSVVIKPTHTGRLRLRRGGPLALTTRAGYLPAGGPWDYRLKRFTLR